MKNKILLILIIAIYSNVIYGSDSLKTQITLKYNSLEQSLNTKIDNEILSIKRENINDKKELNNLSKRIDNLVFTEWLIGGIVGSGIMLILALLFIPKYIRKQILKTVANSIGVEEEKIQNVVLKNNRINILKSNLKVVIIGSNEENDLQLFNYLKKFNFKNLERKTLGSFTSINCDVIIFNNIKNYLSDELVNDFINKSNSKICFLYYGRYNANIISENVNFSNSKFTLYHRLIETMDIQDVLK